MNRITLTLITVVSLIAPPASAHDLEHQVTSGEAVIVAFSFGDGSPFSYEQFEVFREDESIPFQTGRTDALGRIVLLPDRSGDWHIKVHSEDGHGADLELFLEEHGDVGTVSQPWFARYSRILTGVGVIFGVFGLISLLARRRTRA